ncbi:MAG: ABC transporter substrate-binding protein [Chloroflexi bacterium]|nr:ABC transporter substrate-binding protein [Chloroflexota bacterium]
MYRPSPWTPHLVAGLAALALIAAACGGTAPTPTPTRAPATTAPAATPTTAPVAQATPTRAAAAQATATPTAPRAAATPAPQAAASRGKVIYAKPVDMGRSTTVQPAGGAGGPDTPFNSSLDAGLTAQTRDGVLVPWLATSWKFVNNDRSIEITIRDGAVFHDGTPVTVDDVVYRLDDLYMNGYKNVPGAARVVIPPVPQAVEKIGPKSLRITFDIPHSGFLTETMLTEGPGGHLSIYPKAYIQRVGFDEFYKKPVGAGPYKLARRTAAVAVFLEAHEQFLNGPPPVKSIEVRIAPEDSTRVAMFLTGEADIAESIAPQFLPQVERVPGAKVLSVRSGQEVVIHFQSRDEKLPGTDLPSPFRDVRVRRAFSHAVDRKAIVERIAGRAGVPVKGPWSDFHSGYDGDRITEYEYNPEKAKQLLKEANFPFDITFPVYAYVASAPAPQAVESYANYLQAVGVKAQYRLVEVSSLIRLWRDKTAYPMSFVRSWNVYKSPIRGHYNSYLHTDGASSFANDPKMDALALEAALIAEPEAHNQALKKLYRYMHEQANVVDLYGIVDNHAIGPKVDWRYPPGLPSRLDLITWRQ